MAERRVIQTDETLPILQAIPLALRHLMARFAATVLVPLLRESKGPAKIGSAEFGGGLAEQAADL